MRWALTASVILLSGCAAYSPPVRSLGYGAPGRLKQGDLEIGGGFAAPGIPAAGGGWLAYALRDWASLEVGADGSGNWGMGFVGSRFTYAPRREQKLHGALDAEVGLGLGAGGNQACDAKDSLCDDRPWNKRIAGGGYLGGGAGYHFSFFALYARGRAQPTGAAGLPFTLWGQAQGGIQFRIAKMVDLFSSVGIGGFVTPHTSDNAGFIWDFGVSVHFDPRARRAKKTATRGLRLRM